MLLGRRAERAELESLFERARAGRSAALVLRGPAGVGKSALLEHAAATAAAGGLSVLRATGVEAESELPFAGLHQLLRPLVHRIDQLPVPQCRALRAALALEPGDGADRFVVSAAVLTLLADSAGQPGLLCLLDDAQWLDRPSLDVLLFVARRLDAEGIALVLAVRDGHLPPRVTANLAVLPVGPLDRSDAARLVADRAGVPVPDAVLTRLLHLTGGNALALAELTGLLAEDVLRGRAALPDPPPIGAGMEDAFLTRVRALPPDTQLLLLVAAAEGTGDIGTVLRAAAQLDVAERALDPAEADGLLQLTPDGLVFRHPLVRSAVYGGVSSSQRRSAHLALAEVLRHPTESDRRAWHRGAAALGPDDDVADALAASAERSRARSGYAGAAAGLRR
ncbi:MAG TPA: AAA family ATPase, partial [Pilimelia sp.]|nr:AAA family ATPase [Pilimelia sp.]